MGKTKYPLIILLAFALFSCVDIKTLPDQPRIEFTSFTIFDTVDILGNSAKGGRLKFYFEDGNGDVGLPAPDGTPEGSDSTNLFFNLFRVTDGKLVSAQADDPLKPTGYRIPYINKNGQNKILQGTIAVTFLYLFYSDEDSIKYSFYLKDREENISNTDSTGVIAVDVNGVYLR